MIEIARSSFHINTHQRSAEELRHLALRLFAEYEELASTGLNIDDFAIEFDLENGSLIGEAWIAVTSHDLFQAICVYGSFFAGIEVIGKHTKALGKLIANKAPTIVGDPNAKKKYQATAGDLNAIQSFFRQVRSGNLSEEDAIKKIALLFESQGESLDKSMREAIKDSIDKLEHYPEQSMLPFFESSEDDVLTRGKEKTKRQTPDLVEISEELRLKIKVRRESRLAPSHSQLIVEEVESVHRSRRRTPKS